jgi:hypothetical protein
MTEQVILLNSYDITENLIKENPADENKIINEYINFLIKLKINNDLSKSYIRSSTQREFDLPVGINIQNNFQKYSNGELLAPATPTVSAKLESFNDYYKEITGGFNDYFAFKN